MFAAAMETQLQVVPPKVAVNHLPLVISIKMCISMHGRTGHSLGWHWPHLLMPYHISATMGIN